MSEEERIKQVSKIETRKYRAKLGNFKISNTEHAGAGYKACVDAEMNLKKKIVRFKQG